MSGVRQRLAATAAAVAVALAAASCGGGDSSGSGSSDQTVSIVDLQPYAVKHSDLPAAFKEKQRQTEETVGACFRPADDTEKELVARIGAFGLNGCEAVTYEHKVDADADLVGTFALLFKDAAGAEGALPLVRDILVKSYRATGNAKVVSVTELPVPALGDQALPAVLVKLTVGDAEKEHTLYFWRRGKVVDVLAVADFLDQINPDGARDIATRIDTRAAG